MCGIAGYLALDGNHTDNIPSIIDIKRMIGALRHRGPEDTGIYIDDSVGLGHARLNIIDLAGGTQPISNEDGRYWIIFNGEIFNYPELRKELDALGHHFRTSSDTEIIVHMYEEKGPACLDDLIGQFAFAIWDTRDRELFLARDRVGIRPLHYIEQNGVLLFASEIKAIFATGLVDPGIDPIALDQVFTFWTTLPGRTMFKDIHELPQGHYMTVRNGHVTIRRYWEIPSPQDDELAGIKEEELTDRIHDLLLDATRIRLRADVPVGAYLSGGLDSSGITSLVSHHFNNEVETFGIRFEEQEYDEGSEQLLMAQFLGVRHHELVATNESIRTSLENVVWHCEKPLLRTSPVPLYLLSGLVRDNGLKVVLTGEGADEVFGGYNIFRETKVRRFWAREPESQWRPKLLGKLYPYIFRDPRAALMLQHFFARGLAETDDPLYSHYIRWNNTSRLKHLFSAGLQKEIGSYNGLEDLRFRLPENFGTLDWFSQAQYLEMSIFMSNYLLSSQGDRVAMAHSLEIRLPYLDHRLIELMARVPAKWKIHGMDEKFILKRTLRKYLPETITNRPKNPYRAPISQGLLHPETLEVILRPNHEFFDMEGVRQFVDRISNSKRVSEVDNMGLVGILTTSYLYNSYLAAKHAKPVADVSPDRIVDRRTIKDTD